jgi:hypothetical protein
VGKKTIGKTFGKTASKMTATPRYWNPGDPEFWEQRAAGTRKMLANVDRQFTRLDLQRKQLVEDIAEAEGKAKELRKGRRSGG